MVGGSGIEAEAREIVRLARAGASRARLRARLTTLVVLSRRREMVLSAQAATLLAGQIPLWIGGRDTIARTSQAIGAFLEPR